MAGINGRLDDQADGVLLAQFLAGGDSAAGAFGVILERHGPMVIAVCRSVLGRSHDAEDAFQATFLILVRRGDTILDGDALASWLHGVARRVALRARKQAASRRTREGLGVPDSPGRTHNPAGDELLGPVSEEIDRLPPKYRTPLILCGLEGRTHAEAARRLGWPVGTLSGRLSRARALLRDRCVRRGLTLPALGLGWVTSPASASLAGPTTGAAAPPGGAAGSPAPGLAAGVIALLRGFLIGTGPLRTRLIAALLGAAGVVGAGSADSALRSLRPTATALHSAASRSLGRPVLPTRAPRWCRGWGCPATGRNDRGGAGIRSAREGSDGVGRRLVDRASKSDRVDRELQAWCDATGRGPVADGEREPASLVAPAPDSAANDTASLDPGPAGMFEAGSSVA